MRAAVLDAVADELLEHGLAGFSVERLATRAGVARNTVYTHWPNKRALIVAATAERHGDRLPVLDSGDWPSDLRFLCTSIAEGFSEPRTKTLLRTHLAAADSDPELHRDMQSMFAAESTHLRTPIVEAKKRGEIRADVEISDVLSSISGPLFMHAVWADNPVAPHVIDWIVESVLAATAPVPVRGTRRSSTGGS